MSEFETMASPADHDRRRKNLAKLDSSVLRRSAFFNYLGTAVVQLESTSRFPRMAAFLPSNWRWIWYYDAIAAVLLCFLVHVPIWFGVGPHKSTRYWNL